MISKALSVAVTGAALSFAIAAPAAQAACGSRPGTPNEVKAELIGQDKIRFSWRNTTGRGMNRPGSTSSGDSPHRMYFDISVRDGRGNMVGKDMTGTGPFSVTYGSRSQQEFAGLVVPATYCFRIRARTEGGTQGCVSQIFSAQVCATTLATPPATPPASVPPKTTGRPRVPSIGVERRDGNEFFFKGTGFLPNAPVTIRAADDQLRNEFYVTIGGRRILSDASGRLDLRLVNICKGRGNLYFSANDGRKNASDRTGTLWSNTARTTCQ